MDGLERKIATRLVTAALAKGYFISVFDGEEWTLKRSFTHKSIMGALGTTDSDVLRFYHDADASIGSIWLIWGNGEDLISDYTDNELMEALCKEANRP